VTPELLMLVLERRSESRENMLSNVDFSFVKAERCTLNSVFSTRSTVFPSE
jgi:hypothetical protein